MTRAKICLLRPMAWSRHGAVHLAFMLLLAAATSAGCGGETPKPPAGSEESPLDLKVEVDEPSPGTAPESGTPKDGGDSSTPAATAPPATPPAP